MDPIHRRKFTKELLSRMRQSHCGSCAVYFPDVSKVKVLTKDGEEELFYFCSQSCAEYYIDEYVDDFKPTQRNHIKLIKKRKKRFWK